jgi:hypothetical protein
MIELDSGNVLLKPSLRRQLMGWLRRSLRLGSRLGNFILKINLKKVGRSYDVSAQVRDSAGQFRFHMRRHDLKNAFRELARRLTVRLHEQCMARTPAVA